MTKSNQHEIEIELVEQKFDDMVLPTSGLKGLRFQFRSYLAEFIGSLILVLFGCGGIAQVTINKAAIGSSYLSINFGWAWGLMLAVYISGPISGGHLNPAVTIASALLRNFPYRQVPGYILSQLLGSFGGAALVYLIYWPALEVFDGGIRTTTGHTSTAGIFATYPHPNASHLNSFLVEMVITALFLMCIQGITDRRSNLPPSFTPFIIGLSLGAIGLSVGVMTGFAVNPARDLGPRLFTLFFGWGSAPFTAFQYYFWIPILAPICGAILGIAIYDVIICPLDFPFQ